MSNRSPSTETTDHEHASPMILCIVFMLLMVLLVATVIASKLIHGTPGIIIGLSISVIKTLLIAAIFMNLKGSIPLIRLAAAAGIFWLTFAMMFIIGDYATRGWDETQDQTLQNATNLDAYDRPTQ